MKKIKRVFSICLIIIMMTNFVAFGELNIKDNIKGAILGDLVTGEVLYEYNTNEQLAIASISKLMTYLLMKDAVATGEISLDDDVLISGHAAATEGSRFGIKSGETLKLSMLTQGMLVVSGNDCATAIAEYVGKSEDNFVKMMNKKAGDLGLMSASFVNPTGLPINDEDAGQNHMSISDIYKLARHILSTYPEILEITSQKELSVPERNFRKASTNPVLGIIDGVDGLKTGYTDKSGLCLVSTMPVTGNGTDFRLIAIIMGAATNEDRINKTKELLEYGRSNYSYQRLTDIGKPVDNVYISSSKTGEVEVYPASDYYKMVKTDEIVKTEITYNDKVSAPIAKGEKIGTITIYINDKEIGKIDAIVNGDIQKANIFVRIIRFFKNLF